MIDKKIKNILTRFCKKFCMLFKELTADDLRYFTNENFTIIKWADVDYDEFEEFAVENDFDVSSYPVEMTDCFIKQLSDENRKWLEELVGKEFVDTILKGKFDALMIDIE